MNPSKQIQIETDLNESCRNFVFSGFQLSIESPQGEVHWAGGRTTYWPSSSEVDKDTFFDLGSLTKVILTTSVLARLVDQKKIDLNSSLKDHLEPFKNSGYGKITLRQLLSHSSGLIAWFPFYREKDRNLISTFLKRESEFLSHKNVQKTVYSDLGFLLLGEVLRNRFGDLNKLFLKEVVEPLKLKDIVFGPVSLDKSAATEYCLERAKLLHGEVFDHNTEFFGGVCSHAGLFSSARNLLPWAREWLKAVDGTSSWLSQGVACEFVQKVQENSEGTWGLGWDTKSKAFSSAGELFSSNSFGHLGFPGTSIWIDPKRKGIAILLTNRIHPSRLDERIKKLRPFIHDRVVQFWENYER